MHENDDDLFLVTANLKSYAPHVHLFSYISGHYFVCLAYCDAQFTCNREWETLLREELFLCENTIWEGPSGVFHQRIHACAEFSIQNSYQNVHMREFSSLFWTTNWKIPVINSFLCCSGQIDRRYTNEQLVVEVPAGVTVCDMGSLTVWCQPFFATFSRITIPRSLFVSTTYVGTGHECLRVAGG